MGQFEKLLQNLKTNPKADWKIEDLKRISHKLGIDHRQPGTSHVTFRFPDGEKLTVPARKPIKPIYIKMFIALAESQEGYHE